MSVEADLSTDRGKILGGAYVSVHGMPFFASFHTDLVEILEARSSLGLATHFSSNGLKHLYHPGAIAISRREGSPLYLGLSWGGFLRYADGTAVPYPSP